MKLVIGERKSLNALTYLIIVLMAYYGPNAELFGNIQLSIWQFQRPIKDIQAYVFKVCLLLGVDLLSLVVNVGMLWYFCKINLLTMLRKLQKAFWHVFAMAEAFIILEVNGLQITYAKSSLITLLLVLDFCSADSWICI